MLALRALRRIRILALVVLPYGAALAVLAVVGPALAEPDRIGLSAVALAPALLTAPALATAIGGRMDRAGALVVGSIGMWLVLTLSRGPAAATATQNAVLPFIAGAAVISVVPLLPELIRTIAQRIGDAAFLVLLAIALTGAAGLNPTNGLAALALFAAVAASAAIVARIGGVDQRSALAGAGSRDPAVATGLAVALGGSTAVPLYSAMLLLAGSALLAVWNRRKAR